jgi:hypothetical protein
MQKRIQALPLRMSDPSKKWPGPPTLPSHQNNSFSGQQSLPRTITPCDSDSEDTCKGTFGHNGQQQPGFGGVGVWADANMAEQLLPSFCLEPELSPGEDMDMMMDAPEPEGRLVEQQQQQQLNGHSYLQAGSLQPDPIGTSTITDRMPTPLQPSFAAQVRGGKNWGGAAGNIMADPQPQRTSHMDATGQQVSMQAMSLHESPSRPRAGATSGANPVIGDWNLVQNRRLPSPISEGGGECECGDSPGSSGMVMDSNTPPDHHDNPFSSLPPRSSSAMAMGGNQAAVNIPPRAETPHVIVTGGMVDDGSMDVEATTPSPPRKGHHRSKHTVNNWTLQPGMKKSFSIGYRADCEKCRLKVPGHFNHIIIS